MSRRITLITKVCVVLFAVLFLQNSANAITYTAVASGNFSSSATWMGGNAPSQNLTLLDQINIGAGITVNLDQDLVINTLVSGGLNVDGSLVSSNSSDLILTGGTLTGNGTINVDSLALGLTSGFTFTGNITANDFSSTTLNSTTTADITVSNQLWLNGSLDFLTNSSLTLSNNSTIVVTGGLFTNSGGTLNLNNNYNVVYNGGSLNSGLELTGSGLQSVTVNLGNSSSTITLMTDLTVNGTLSLTSGRLVLSGNDLTIATSGDISASGSGSIVSTSSSNISINATGGTGGSLNFSGNGNAVNNFTVNVGSGSQTSISGTVAINGALNITSGTFNFSGADLTLGGSLTGSGSLYGDSNSDLNITAAAGLTTALTFATNGNNVGDLSIATGNGTSVSLGSDLNVHGNVSIAANNQFNISDDELTIMGGLTGSGSLTTNSNSGLYIETGSNTTLNITGTNGTIGDLGFDGNSGSTSLTLTGDLVIAGSLDLDNGALVLAGNDLTITSTGDISAGGSGTIVSTSSSNISINATGGTSGSLNFSGSGNAVNNFTVNVGAGSETSIDGDLTIDGALNITSGTFNFSDADLTLDGTLSGSGSLYSNSNSDLDITATAGLATDLNFATGGQSLNDLNINVGSGSSVSLGTALVISGDLLIAAGTQFDITDEQLTVNGTIVGSGTLTTNNGSGLVLNTGSNTSLNITGTSGTIGTLGFNGSNANTTLSLTGDLTVATSLSLQSGTLDLNDNDLNVTGGIAGGGSGTISSSNSSSVSVVTTATLAGGLSFNSSGNTVDDFTVNVGTGNSLDLNTDLTVTGQLQLQGGTVNVDDNDLTIAVGGSVSGGSEDNYVNTSGGGSLNISLTANTSATFDVGTDNNYAPANVELNNGSASGNVGVSVQANVMAQGTAGSDLSVSQSVVDATWHVTSDITANLNLDLEVMWSSGMEVNSFDRANAYIAHYTNASWDATADVAATTEANGMFSLRRDGITSLSPFAVFDENTVTGISETAKALEFRMFPNPSTTNMVITCPEANNENLMVDIMNIQGGIVKSYNLTSDNYSIPVSDLANGSYIARVYNAKVNGVQKFTKM